LVIPERRCLAFIRIDWWAFDTLDRVALDGISFAQVLKEGGQGGQFPADRRTAQLALL
jgi:hypothetical protein